MKREIYPAKENESIVLAQSKGREVEIASLQQENPTCGKYVEENVVNLAAKTAEERDPVMSVKISYVTINKKPAILIGDSQRYVRLPVLEIDQLLVSTVDLLQTTNLHFPNHFHGGKMHWIFKY